MGYISSIITKSLLNSQNLFKPEMSVPVGRIIGFLENQPHPKDLIDRSYYQYKGNKMYMVNTAKLLFPIVSLFVAPIFIIIALLRRVFTQTGDHIDCIGHFDGLSEIIPESLNTRYDIDKDHWSYRFSLSIKDLFFVIRIWLRYPISLYFVLKCMFNIAKYSDMIKRYSPNAIICHAEFSFTSSVLTAYCRRHGVKHINVMHGEKCLCAKDSFFAYDECYVWDKFYEDLFLREKCEPRQFKVEVPPSLKINVDNHKNEECYADYKYYLWEDDPERLRIIYQSFKTAREHNKSIKYRLHPRYCDIDKVSKVIPISEIENPRDVSILESLSNTSCAVGFLTTVMAQAYYSNIPLLIDDVAYSEDYAEAKKYSYMLATKKLPLLSSINV